MDKPILYFGVTDETLAMMELPYKTTNLLYMEFTNKVIINTNCFTHLEKSFSLSINQPLNLSAI